MRNSIKQESHDGLAKPITDGCDLLIFSFLFQRIVLMSKNLKDAPWMLQVKFPQR